MSDLERWDMRVKLYNSYFWLTSLSRDIIMTIMQRAGVCPTPDTDRVIN